MSGIKNQNSFFIQFTLNSLLNSLPPLPSLPAYMVPRSPLRQEIIALLRSKGGKANCYDENGRYVGEGNGDLND